MGQEREALEEERRQHTAAMAQLTRLSSELEESRGEAASEKAILATQLRVRIEQWGEKEEKSLSKGVLEGI